MKSQSVLSKSVRGSGYNIAVSAVTIVLGFIRSVLLMRLLAPDQFGVVALALFLMTFLRPFSVFGIDSALIQRQEVRQETFSTHFVTRLALAILVLAIGLAASPFLRRVYADQVVVVDVFLVLLGLNVLVASFSTPGVILRREMRFGSLALLNLASSLAMTITAPLLAYLGAGLWSLVAEQAVGPIVRWIGLWVVFRPWRPSLRFNWGEARSALRFGRQVFSANILGTLLDRFDDFWTGTALGPTALGYYSRAYEMAQYPERVLATPITSVFFSTYAAVQEDKEDLSKAFFRSSSFLVRIGLLMAVVLLATAPEVTLILFGEKWLPIVPVFRLMLVYIMLDPIYVNLSYLIIGVGRPDWLSRVRLIQTALFVVTVIVFARLWSINGVAMAANLMMLSGTLALLVYSRRFVSYSISRMFLWPAVATAVSIGFGYWLSQSVQPSSLWWTLILKSISITGIYILILYLTERQIIHEYSSQMLQPLWNEFRARTSSKSL
jgi:O-antigen/teichoic acid export membrane protein